MTPPTDGGDMSDRLVCVPEWCAQEGDHDETCPERPMTMTKSEFVVAAEGGAAAAIETYLFLRDDERLSHEEALEITVTEANESAMCFAGIGSCGRGWCKHS